MVSSFNYMTRLASLFVVVATGFLSDLGVEPWWSLSQRKGHKERACMGES